MRKTRLVILPGARCLHQLGYLLLFLACPTIAFKGQENRDIEPYCRILTLKQNWLPNYNGERIGCNGNFNDVPSGLWYTDYGNGNVCPNNNTKEKYEISDCQNETELGKIDKSDKKLNIVVFNLYQNYEAKLARNSDQNRRTTYNTQATRTQFNGLRRVRNERRQESLRRVNMRRAVSEPSLSGRWETLRRDSLRRTPIKSQLSRIISVERRSASFISERNNVRDGTLQLDDTSRSDIRRENRIQTNRGFISLPGDRRLYNVQSRKDSRLEKSIERSDPENIRLSRERQNTDSRDNRIYSSKLRLSTERRDFNSIRSNRNDFRNVRTISEAPGSYYQRRNSLPNVRLANEKRDLKNNRIDSEYVRSSSDRRNSNIRDLTNDIRDSQLQRVNNRIDLRNSRQINEIRETVSTDRIEASRQKSNVRMSIEIRGSRSNKENYRINSMNSRFSTERRDFQRVSRRSDSENTRLIFERRDTNSVRSSRTESPNVRSNTEIRELRNSPERISQIINNRMNSLEVRKKNEIPTSLNVRIEKNSAPLKVRMTTERRNSENQRDESSDRKIVFVRNSQNKENVKRLANGREFTVRNNARLQRINSRMDTERREIDFARSRKVNFSERRNSFPPGATHRSRNANTRTDSLKDSQDQRVDSRLTTERHIATRQRVDNSDIREQVRRINERQNSRSPQHIRIDFSNVRSINRELDDNIRADSAIRSNTERNSYIRQFARVSRQQDSYIDNLRLSNMNFPNEGLISKRRYSLNRNLNVRLIINKRDYNINSANDKTTIERQSILRELRTLSANTLQRNIVGNKEKLMRIRSELFTRKNSESNRMFAVEEPLGSVQRNVEQNMRRLTSNNFIKRTLQRDFRDSREISILTRMMYLTRSLQRHSEDRRLDNYLKSSVQMNFSGRNSFSRKLREMQINTIEKRIATREDSSLQFLRRNKRTEVREKVRNSAVRLFEQNPVGSRTLAQGITSSRRQENDEKKTFTRSLERRFSDARNSLVRGIPIIAPLERHSRTPSDSSNSRNMYSRNSRSSSLQTTIAKRVTNPLRSLNRLLNDNDKLTIRITLRRHAAPSSSNIIQRNVRSENRLSREGISIDSFHRSNKQTSHKEVRLERALHRNEKMISNSRRSIDNSRKDTRFTRTAREVRRINSFDKLSNRPVQNINPDILINQKEQPIKDLQTNSMFSENFNNVKQLTMRLSGNVEHLKNKFLEYCIFTVSPSDQVTGPVFQDNANELWNNKRSAGNYDLHGAITGGILFATLFLNVHKKKVY